MRKSSEQALPVGTRVRLNEKCVWPERRGCLATVVDYPEPGVYPDPVGPGMVLVRITADPLEQRTAGDRGWSCVISAKSCEVLP